LPFQGLVSGLNGNHIDPEASDFAPWANSSLRTASGVDPWHKLDVEPHRSYGPNRSQLDAWTVAWALARGQPPSDQLIDQLRYLRQLGVPFSKAELGAGSGNRIRYGLIS
jgi:hypothetical protein